MPQPWQQQASQCGWVGTYRVVEGAQERLEVRDPT